MSLIGPILNCDHPFFFLCLFACRCFSTWCATLDRAKTTRRKPTRANRNRPGRNSNAPFSNERRERKKTCVWRREGKKEENFKKKQRKQIRPHPVNAVERIGLRGGSWNLFLAFISTVSPREINYSYSSLFFLLFASGSSSRKTLAATFPFSCGLFRAPPPSSQQQNRTKTFCPSICWIWMCVYVCVCVYVLSDVITFPGFRFLFLPRPNVSF